MPKRSAFNPRSYKRSSRRRAAITNPVIYRFNRPMSKKKRFAASRFNSAVMRAVNRNAETKEVLMNVATNAVVLHNTILNLDHNAFYCNIGSSGEMIGSGSVGARTGKKLFCKGISVSLHIENQQYRPFVRYSLLLVRAKPNADNILDIKSKLFEGLNTTIPLDYIDTSKVDIIYQKNFNVKAPNVGTTESAGPAGVFDHGEVEGILPDLYEGINTVSTNPRFMGKFYVPINKTIMYRDYADGANAQTIPSSYRYQWVIYAYDNRTTTTGDSTWPVGHVNMTTKMKFTDV